ncbi:MAG: hypothetical protein ACXW2P_09140, partial [Thermoanaerobaculia bacterium]
MPRCDDDALHLHGRLDAARIGYREPEVELATRGRGRLEEREALRRHEELQRGDAASLVLLDLDEEACVQWVLLVPPRELRAHGVGDGLVARGETPARGHVHAQLRPVLHANLDGWIPLRIRGRVDGDGVERGEPLVETDQLALEIVARDDRSAGLMCEPRHALALETVHRRGGIDRAEHDARRLRLFRERAKPGSLVDLGGQQARSTRGGEERRQLRSRVDRHALRDEQHELASLDRARGAGDDLAEGLDGSLRVD